MSKLNKNEVPPDFCKIMKVSSDILNTFPEYKKRFR